MTLPARVVAAKERAAQRWEERRQAQGDASSPGQPQAPQAPDEQPSPSEQRGVKRNEFQRKHTRHPLGGDSIGTEQEAEREDES